MDVSKFVLDGQEISVKDANARSSANSAVATANSALEKAIQIEAESRLTMSYSQSTETITFVTGTH